MTPNVSPTTKNPSHHISLQEAENSAVIYGLILRDNGKAIQRRPKTAGNHVPFTQKDWSGGRGLKNATDDRSRYADGKRLNTRRAGIAMLGGLETYTNGHRKVEQYMPADAEGMTWQSLLTTNKLVAHKVTISATGNRARAYIWIRKRGNPGALAVRLKANNAGDPGTELKEVQIEEDDVDTISVLYEFTFPSVRAVANAEIYWVEVEAIDAGDASNYWQVGVDQGRGVALTKRSADGTTWANATHDLYYRLVDDTDIAGVMFFTYKSQLYCLTRPTTTSAPRLFMNGFRGVATGGAQSRTVLQDTNQTFPDLAGCLLLITDGQNSEWSQPYRTIISNDADEITTSSWGRTHLAASTTYVILGTNLWTEITGHGLTVLPTDVKSAGDVLYFAQGDSVKMRRMQETNIAGVWTRTFAEEDNYAKLLMVYNEGRNLTVIKVNDYDNSNRPSVASAKAEAWGTRLKWPWLIDACEVITGWTAATNVTRTADGALYKTGSASIKFAIAGGAAAGVFGYRAFAAPLSLFYQNKIRLWVYSTSQQDKGQYKLRLSEAADASTSNQDLDMPFIEANKWTQIELPIRHQAGLHNINSIGFVRIAGFTGALDFYVDGLETMPDGSETPLGDDMQRTNGIELYGDPELPWILRTGSIGYIMNGIFVPVPLREYETVENIHNGQGHVVHKVYLYFSFLQGMEEYYRANMDDVGPNRDEGLPYDRQGYITSMLGYPDRIVSNYDAGIGGYSSIMSRKGGGYHEEFRSDTPGKRIRKVFHQVIPGDMADRLWFSEGEDIAWLPQPGNTVNELTDETYLFTHEAVMETGWIGDDQQRLFSSVKIGSENLNSLRCIEWDYMLDEATTWTPHATPFTTGPVQTIILNKTGKRIKLRFRMQSNENIETPRITSINISTTERPDIRYTYSCNFTVMDKGHDLNGDVENYERAETPIQQFDTWTRNQTLITIRSTSELFDNKTVYIDSVIADPAANDTQQQQEKIIGTLTFTDPQ
jgi:hypothetical protein